MPTNIMPHVGMTTKQQDSSTTRNSSEAGSSKAKKKKRPRVRVRARNKCCRLAAAATAEAEANAKQQQVNSNTQQKERAANTANNIEMKPASKPAPSPANAVPTGAMPTVQPESAAAKSREQIMAEREAKKLAKQAKKTKSTAAADVSKVEPTAVPAATAAAKDKPQPANAVAVSEQPPAAVVPTQAVPVKTAASVKTAAPVTTPTPVANQTTGEKSREQIMAEREAKKLAKQAAKASKSSANATTDVNAAVPEQNAVPTVASKEAPAAVAEDKKKPTLTKAERRAIQEAQRAAKAQTQTAKQAVMGAANKTAAAAAAATSAKGTTPSKATATGKLAAPTTQAMSQIRKISAVSSSPVKSPLKSNDCNVKLFNHLASARKDVNLFVNNPLIHPSIARLGEQYAKRTVVGSNARCIAFLNALKSVIHDFVTPPKKAFSRSLETTISNSVEHLQKCRPLAVSVVNAHKHMKHVLTQLPSDQTEMELKENLCHFIDTYIENQIDKAAQAISSSMQEKISNGDVILTFGCSSLINFICEEAHRRHVDFRVVVVDSRPFCEGQELLRRLTNKGIPCTYVLINAVSFVMPEVTKVLLGAHALLSNGYVMGRVGTAQVALVAQSFNVPVLVCCETHKFSERFQTDAIVYNELGNPNDLVISDKCCLTNWQTKSKMSPLNLIYDITPSELVTAVVTEVSILPCTSVPVILRIKPTEIGY